MVIPLERLDSSSSNSPPHLEEVQIPNPPGMDNNQMCLGYQGGGGEGWLLKLQIYRCICIFWFVCLFFVLAKAMFPFKFFEIVLLCHS